MGEPVDKNLWGELEPEEGVSAWLVLDGLSDNTL